MRDGFIFYRSFYEAISDLEDAQQLEIYKAIAEYSLNFREPILSGVSATIFKLVKPQLEANNKRYMNGTQPKNKQNGSKTEAKISKTEAKEKEKEKEKEKDKFSKPTFAEIEEFISANSYKVDAVSFYAHYENNGWKVGKNRMKDYKLAVIGWDRRNRQ